MAKKVVPKVETFARIKVVGIGGAGGAAVNRMMETGIKDMEFIVINTDAQALHHSLAPTKIHIGKETTRGLGAGSDPAVGQKAAEESRDEIRQALEGADMVFIAFGAGGGTGSGAAHVVAEIAQGLDILTVVFATKPFRFEGDKRQQNADFAIRSLEDHVDTLVLIPNDRLLETIDRKTPMTEAFRIADDVLRQGVQGISDLITVHGLINLDFADVKAIMKNSGQALMGIGRASGDDRAEVAAQQAIESPLLEVSIEGARGVLFNVIGGHDMAMHEINNAAAVITDVADQDVNVIFGATINPDIEGEVIVTVVATGFTNEYTRLRSSKKDQDQTQDQGKGKEKEREPKRDNPKKTKTPLPKKEEPQEEDLDDIAKDIDDYLDDNAKQEKKTTKKDTLKSMWSNLDDKDEREKELEKPAFLRRFSRKKDKED